MNKEEFIAKLHLLYTGEINALSEIVRVYDNLQHQLKERDKVIEEIKNDLTNYKSEWAEDDEVVKDINKFLEILERGKNVNSK